MKRSLIRSLAIFLTLLSLTFSAIGVTPVQAATLIVTTANNNGAGSLRQAITDAPSGATITFDSSLSGATIYLASTLPLSKDVTIDGSALASQITISGDTDGNSFGDVRVFYINSGLYVGLVSLIIAHGYDGGSGGGIYNIGTLYLYNSTLFGNYVHNIGGGIYNTGNMFVTNSTLYDNSADSTGGGIYNSGTLTVTNSTLSGNSALYGGYGGGIYNSGTGTLTITNSTLSGNSANNSGGGISNSGTLTLTNSTLSGNSANNNGGGIDNSGNINIYNTSIVINGADADVDFTGNGGGVYIYPGATFAMRNTLVAGNNLSDAPVYQDCYGEMYSYGRNLLWDVNGCTVYTMSGGWMLLNSLSSIGPLQNNGGPTWTHALLPGSNAIDGGDPVLGCVDQNSTTLTTDQRGAAREVGALCDIGAYEFIPPVTVKSIDSQDGWILESSETSGLGGTLNNTATTFRLGDDVTKKQYRGILSFNTSSLPDNAIIIKVTLKVKQQAIVGGGNPVTTFQGFMVDIKKGVFGTTTLQASDFQTVANKAYGPFNTAPTSGWYSLNLTAGKAYINKLTTGSGLTQIRLRFKLDDNNNTIANYLSLYSGNAGAASRPQLIVEYYVP